MRVFVCDQEVITKFSSLYWGRVGGCSLGKLAGSCCVLFLQEQVSDLRVQEFLKELVIGFAAPSDFAGSIMVKILHSGEGGDVEQVTRTSKQFSRVCDCLFFSTHLCFISCILLIVHISICWYDLCLIDICLGLFNILHALIHCSSCTCLILYLCAHT